MSISKTQVHHLPILDPSDFDPAYDYIIVQHTGGDTYKARASVLGETYGTPPGATFLPAMQQIGTSSGDIGNTPHQVSHLSVDAHTAIVSVRQAGGAWPGITFYYYTSSDFSASNKHTIQLNKSGTSQSVHEMILVPVVDGHIYWSIDQFGAGGGFSGTCYVYFHGYIT